MFYSIPTATRALIIANIAMFGAQALVGDALIVYLGLWPINTAGNGLGFAPWQLVTYSFLHGNMLHLFFNMFALYMFGGELERLFGPKRYLNLYFLSVIAAAITQLVFSAIAGGEPYPTVGASGGVFGLLLAYGILSNPNGHAAFSADPDAGAGIRRNLRRVRTLPGCYWNAAGRCAFRASGRHVRCLALDPLLARSISFPQSLTAAFPQNCGIPSCPRVYCMRSQSCLASQELSNRVTFRGLAVARCPADQDFCCNASSLEAKIKL